MNFFLPICPFTIFSSAYEALKPLKCSYHHSWQCFTSGLPSRPQITFILTKMLSLPLIKHHISNSFPPLSHGKHSGNTQNYEAVSVLFEWWLRKCIQHPQFLHCYLGVNNRCEILLHSRCNCSPGFPRDTAWLWDWWLCDTAHLSQIVFWNYNSNSSLHLLLLQPWKRAVGGREAFQGSADHKAFDIVGNSKLCVLIMQRNDSVQPRHW